MGRSLRRYRIKKSPTMDDAAVDKQVSAILLDSIETIPEGPDNEESTPVTPTISLSDLFGPVVDNDPSAPTMETEADKHCMNANDGNNRTLLV